MQNDLFLLSLASLGLCRCRAFSWLLILLLAHSASQCFLTSIIRAIPLLPQSACRIFANWVFRFWMLECACVASGVLTCGTCRWHMPIFVPLEHLQISVLKTNVALSRSLCLACMLLTIPYSGVLCLRHWEVTLTASTHTVQQVKIHKDAGEHLLEMPSTKQHTHRI